MDKKAMYFQHNGLEVAIIGISGRFPSSNNIENFWENIINGIELISVFPDSEQKKLDVNSNGSNKTIKAGAVLDDIELFDASFFGFNPREAETMDPQHRLFLECAWEALENAGYDSETEERLIGVYAGVGISTYLLYNLSPNRELMESRGFLKTVVGVDKDYVPTRVSYKLNLKGPSVSVQTACSSSLVAVHLACQSLLSGECDMTLAAGVSVKVPQNEVTLSPDEIVSPDGHCKAFDAKANGTIGGNGIGVVVLKRLEDAIADGDYIYAVIKGSAINNDGSMKVGYTAPSEDGQARAIRAAQIMAEVEPETITYLETHGTGTPLGDPIEIAAMTQAFRASTDKKSYCAIGSVKTNVGHLDATAGIAGLIKTVLALNHKLLPPSLNFETPNPQIDFENSPFYVNTKLSEWKANSTPRRAGVSSFGFGGTNAHVILEEAPPVEAFSPSRPKQLLVLSAKTSSALDTATANLANHLKHHPDLNIADVAYTLQVGRRTFNHRRMVIVEDLEDAVTALESVNVQRVFTQFQESGDRHVVFMFSGQGSQYVNMTKELYQSEVIFREECDRCCELLKPHLDLDLRSCLYATEEEVEKAVQQLQQTAITQPALFVIEYSLAKLWMSWGVHPAAMIGHSIGEYVAATLAGVFSLEDALFLVAARGQLMQQLPSGKMLAISLSEKDVQPLLGNKLSLSVINGSSLCVVSGTTDAVNYLHNQLVSQGVECRLLHTSHAFHSEMMEPILAPFTDQVKKVSLKPPQISYLSNVTGTWITATEATDPKYWARHLRQTVRFAEGLQTLLQEPAQILLEVGPGRTLTTLAKRHPDLKAKQVVLSSVRHPQEKQSDVAFLLNTLGQLWLSGVKVDWSGFYSHERRHRMPLPTYPFERQYYWIDPPEQATEEGKFQSLPTKSDFWKSLVEAGQIQASSGISEFDEQIYLENKQWLDRLCTAYINLALRRLGAFSNPNEKYSLEQLFEQCQIIPRYRQLLCRWLQVLVEQDHLQQDEECFINLVPLSADSVNDLTEEVKDRWAQTPNVVNTVDLIQRCGENLATVLIGEKEPLEFFRGLLYDFNEAESKNLESTWHAYYSAIIRPIMEQIVRSLPPLVNLRILEIGSGICYATTELLPVLPLEQTNYTFTDVGGLFLNEAKKRFSAYPSIEYGFLDIDQPPSGQGYSSHSFDVVVASRTLHLAKNIEETLQYVRDLLAPEGLLLLWETTQPTLDFDITWALLMNPLKDEKHSRGNPFLSKEQWQEALRNNGFVEVAAFPETEVFGQRILVAQASASATLPTAFTTTFEQKDADKTPQVSSNKKPDIADWFYIPSWKRFIPSQPFQSGSQTVQPGCWLVFVDECGLGTQIVKRLELECQDVVTVKVGEQFSSERKFPTSQRVYTINPRQRDDYDTLLNELRALNLTPKMIVHLWSVTPHGRAESGLEGVDQVQEKGFYSLLFLAQALGKQNMTDLLQIAVISNNLQSVTGEEMLCPEKATLLGPVKVIPLEYPNIRCRSIDVILPASGSIQEEKLVDHLLMDLSGSNSDEVIAYRSVHRWIPTFEPVRLDEAFEGTPRLRERGVYLITGGLGAIGLTLASHLAKTVRAKLLLTGRSAFPLRDEWSQWLVTHDEDDDVSRKIRKVQELEELGAEVLVTSADAANLEQMQVAIAQAQERFGQINGVIHAAGVLGDSSIQRKTLEQVESVLAPKVKGTLILNALFKDVQLDFFILCSSRASIKPGFGQISYSAANNFLDAFAHYKTCTNGTFTVSINLMSPWLEGGIAVEAAKQLTLNRENSQSRSKTVKHPLFDQCLVEGLDEIYVSNFSIKKHWFLNEHRFMGEAILPGTAYLELARAACEHHTQKGMLEIREVTFLIPLIVKEDEEKEVRTVLKKQGDGFEFLIMSQSNSESEPWQEHAKGKIAFVDVEALPEKYEIPTIEARCNEQEIIITEQAPKTQSELVEYGARWNNLKRVKFGTNQWLAFLELPEEFTDDLKSYKLHPALLDLATGFPAIKFQDQGLYLPFSYKKLMIKGSLPSKVCSYITAAGDNNSQKETLKFNIIIMDHLGTELVEIEEYTLRKVNQERDNSTTAKQSEALGEKESDVAESENFYLTITSPGILDTLIFRPDTRYKPGLGEVEIEVGAIGLNFKEVLLALGFVPVLPDSRVKFGLECAGKIVALGEGIEGFDIGDEVIAFGSSCFSRYVTTAAELVVLKPKHLSLEEAATIPVAFMTAYYSLIKLGRLCQGESVLIHAAAGGVGMAAVQIAQWVGAEIFATAGSPEKREFLHSIGIEHVMDSRSLAFADEVMKRTNGKGVNVVLNSLGGEFIPKGLSILARYGRFLEIGQRDILNNSQLGLGVFEKCLSFFAIQVRPELPYFNSLLNEVVQHFNDKNFSTLPHQVFPITEVVQAFKYMAGAKHIGKLVVSLQDQETLETLIVPEEGVSQRAKETPVVLRHQSSVFSQVGSDLPKKLAAPTNGLLSDFLKDGILPLEGVEVFSRILGSTLPQVLVSTTDLLAGVSRNNVDNTLSSLEISEKASLSQSTQPTHPRPELNNAYVSPRNEVEQTLADIWQEILGIKQIGIHDNFFELKGDSLLAVQVIHKVREKFQVELSTSFLFEKSTVASMAEYIESIRKTAKQLQASTSDNLNDREEIEL